MTKKELISSMETYTGGGFITKADLARFIGVKDARYIDKYLASLQKLGGKYYFIPDVAESMMERGMI